ncbi:glycosyltransferase [Oceanobacillus chungangensis]|uniref:Group 1 glycosyl transferase n=1 Tax=Oceanobacillus chungangensis TaxID=1229152 RepID=A0A3D8PWQ9_9BACI|nr:glycosyltransferase [Oceanobacillus chungangensis]RDW20590.1 group 1 glycosyl transferase [Oceanobacillus chungangensis]
MKRLKILVYGDQDLNIMDGSAIWLTSLINMLSLDQKVDVTLLLKAPIKRKHVIANIKDINSITVVEPFKLFEGKKFQNENRLTVKDATNVIEALNNKNDYDIIITRGKQLTEESLKKSYKTKQIPYITDFTHDAKKVGRSEKLFFKKVYKTFPNVFVQTEEMKQYLMEMLKVDGEKFIILHPTVVDIERPPIIGIKNYSIVYAGKFAKEWKTEEMIDVFQQVNEKNSAITLNVAGDKFQGELKERKNIILDKLKTTNGLNWIGTVSREESVNFIQSSDVGFAYRSEEIDNDYSLELSTKFLEYGINGKPIIARRTAQYEALLGKDYPLFANDEAELYQKLLLAFEDKEIYERAALKCYAASEDYQISRVSKKVLSRLWMFNKEKTTILFAGHDFKFLNWYITKCEEDPNINVLIDKWDGHNEHNIDHSEEMLQLADIIFCEWGLGNAVWYSKNKRRGQKLFIRLHRQEIDTPFLPAINYHNVEKVLVIVPHLFEEFNRLKHVPREKMIIIENMIDYRRFDREKLKNVEYNLGIIGILPKLKRLDRALDIFEQLWIKNPKYKLYIKSKNPQELPWLMGRDDERIYFEEVFERIETAAWKRNVIFDPHGNDVDEWLRKINFVLSTSDIEGSHVSPMEGMASGAVPIVYHWPGAETAYPSRFVVETVDEAVNKIENYKSLIDGYDLKEYPKRFDYDSRVKLLDELIFTETTH